MASPSTSFPVSPHRFVKLYPSCRFWDTSSAATDDAYFAGKTKVVIKILIGLAQQLTPTGHLTPVDDPKPSLQHITIADFMTRGGGDVEVVLAALPSAIRLLTLVPCVVEGGESDWYHLSRAHEWYDSPKVRSSLVARSRTNRLPRFPCRSRDVKLELSEHDANRLLAAIEKRSLKGLSDLEHAHLALLVQTVLEVSRVLLGPSIELTRSTDRFKRSKTRSTRMVFDTSSRCDPSSFTTNSRPTLLVRLPRRHRLLLAGQKQRSLLRRAPYRPSLVSSSAIWFGLSTPNRRTFCSRPASKPARSRSWIGAMRERWEFSSGLNRIPCWSAVVAQCC